MKGWDDGIFLEVVSNFGDAEVDAERQLKCQLRNKLRGY
jgi:hypothetical protein